MAGSLPAMFAALAVLAVAVCLSMMAAPASAQNGYYKKKEEGWFWYIDPKDREPKEEEPVEPPPSPPPAPEPPKPVPKPEDKAFSVAWLRAKLVVLRDLSIEKPTDDNVRAYMYAQRLMLDMSQNFAEVGAKIARTDPMLNEEVRFPFAQAAQREALFAVSKARDQVLDDLRGKVGLWFFFDSNCAFCAGQYRVMTMIAKKRGFSVRSVSIDGLGLPGMTDYSVDKDRAVFKHLDLKLTPAVVMVRPPSDYYVVAHGAMALTDLEDKILAAAVERDLVPPQLKSVVALEQRGIIQPGDVEKMRNGMKNSDDPKELVEMMNKAIQGRF